MSLFAYPMMLTFVIASLALFLVGLFWKKASIVFFGLGIVLITLFFVNALLLNFDLLEIVAVVLTIAILFFAALLIKEKKA